MLSLSKHEEDCPGSRDYYADVRRAVPFRAYRPEAPSTAQGEEHLLRVIDEAAVIWNC